MPCAGTRRCDRRRPGRPTRCRGIKACDSPNVVDGGGLWSNVERSGGRVCDRQIEGDWRCPMFFMGTYTPKLDEKGRLFLPAKFRDRLAEGLVVTQGQENCLVVWPTDVFMEEARRAQATPMTVR